MHHVLTQPGPEADILEEFIVRLPIPLPSQPESFPFVYSLKIGIESSDMKLMSNILG